MTRRHDYRRVKIHRSYTISEAAMLLGVHPHTVHRWIKHGLPVVSTKRPHLIHGSDLRAYLQAQQPRKHKLRAGEIYCLPCKAAKRAAGGRVDYFPETPAKGLLRGSCPTCGRSIYRLASLATLPTVCGDLSVTRRPPRLRLVDSPSPVGNVVFKKEKP